MKLALIGAGQRGMIYARYAHQLGIEIAAVADVDVAKRESAAREFGIPAEQVYATASQLLSKPKLADALILATMDRDHYAQAMQALDIGYHLLLEKPVAVSGDECARIARSAEQKGLRVVVCHVLRYAPFFREIKRILDSGELGRIVTIQHNENIGNFHMAHSFVRGNWRRADEASPIVVQKTCHDMDLLVWLTGSRCQKVSSFGDLTFFRPDHAPAGATERCADCPHRDSCRFSAYLCYLPVMGSWPATVLTADQTPEGLDKAIREGAYGRCVFHCDNDVCDHQVTNMRFENGVTCTFNMSAFTNRMCRTLKVMCENGELRASESENRIEVIHFAATAQGKTQGRIVYPEQAQSGHGGGDNGIVDDFLALLAGEKPQAATDVSISIESHLMSFAAEESRLTGQTIDMDAYRAHLARG